MLGTSIFLAGAEVEALSRSLLENGVKNVLYSYFYIMQMKREHGIEQFQEQYPDVNWFLDSGAFTYMVKHEQEPEKLPPLARYRNRYFNYIEEHGWRYCRVTELDLDTSGIPLETVDSWREEMLERWPHLNIMPVWHPSRGLKAWESYCKDPRIKALAIGSDGGASEFGKLRKMIRLASEYGKPVHGFGMTRIKTTLRHVPYDSCDSTSWVMGQKAGITYIFRANEFRTLPTEDKWKRQLYKSYFKNIGCDPQKIIDDDVAEVRKANVLAWRALADRLEYLKNNGGQTIPLDERYLLKSDLPADSDLVTRAWKQPEGVTREVESPLENTQQRKPAVLDKTPRLPTGELNPVQRKTAEREWTPKERSGPKPFEGVAREFKFGELGPRRRKD